MSVTNRSLPIATLISLLAVGAARAAAPPTPSGPHPRLFMGAASLAAYTANAGKSGTAAAQFASRCQETIDHPEYYIMRGGADGDNWPGAALSCAFAYVTSQKAQFLTQAIKYWRAALEDDQDLGDGLGCVAGVSTNWQSWDGSDPRPPILLTVTHDTGYPMRWYGPDVALVYDWLYNAPGVDDALKAQTRTCLTAWVDYYGDRGYLHDTVAMNYNAGYVIAQTLASVAIGTDGGADGHLWTSTLDTLFGQLLVGQGLLGNAGTKLGDPVGPLVGGDWSTWEYGPLSVVEYSAATLAVEQNGAPQPEMDAWLNSLAVRYIYGTVPHLDGQFCGDGDCGDGTDNVNAGPNANELDAVLLGPSSDQAAAWAQYMKQQQAVSGDYIYNVLGEARGVAPQDFRAQTPAPALWYLARGTRSMYVRTSWDQDAYWAVFTSPNGDGDHAHYAATNFVFSRGADHLIVDPSPYGGYTSWESNALTADSSVVTGDYAPSQTPWSTAELTWARGTADAVFAARSDFAHAFDFNGNASDIPYAHREWVLLPEGEVVNIDRVHTSDPSRNMYLTYHVNTGGGHLTLMNGVATGPVGGSQVAIHAVALSGGTPQITQPSTMDCSLSCNYPCAKCDVARFPVDKYAITLPGPWAVAIHVIDGLGASETAAEVGSVNDDNFDPAPKQNAGVIGAAVYRAMKQSYVVASSAQDGATGATMTYGVPGGAPARHIVFDAPEAADASSSVTAAAQNGRCVVTITAGAGGGFAGRPLMFTISDAASGCQATENTAVMPGMSPPGGVDGGGGGGHPSASGCGCELGRSTPATLPIVLFAAGLVALIGHARARRRRAIPRR